MNGSCLIAMIAFTVTIIGCSSSDDSEPSVALVSGSSCIDSVTISTDLASVQGEVVIEGQSEIDCAAIPNTMLLAPGSSHTGVGTVNYSDQTIRLDGAASLLLDTIEYSNHVGLELYLHDGETRIQEQRSQSTGPEVNQVHRIDWGIYSASLVFSADLASAASAQFEGGVFDYQPEDRIDDPELVGVNSMFLGLLVHDFNRDGQITEGELSTVVGGQISVSGAAPNWQIDLDLTLDDGVNLIGSYVGGLLSIPEVDD